jgi:hypothetical protein
MKSVIEDGDLKNGDSEKRKNGGEEKTIETGVT